MTATVAATKTARPASDGGFPPVAITMGEPAGIGWRRWPAG